MDQESGADNYVVGRMFFVTGEFLLGGGFGIAGGLKLLHVTSTEYSVRSWNRPDLSVEDFFGAGVPLLTLWRTNHGVCVNERVMKD